MIVMMCCLDGDEVLQWYRHTRPILPCLQVCANLADCKLPALADPQLWPHSQPRAPISYSPPYRSLEPLERMVILLEDDFVDAPCVDPLQ